MARTTLVPITGDVLEWAIDESGFSDAEIAAAAGVPVEVLSGWKRGDSKPGLTQFRRVATKLHRPLAVFLLPEPPQQIAPFIQFRDIAGTPARSLNPVERRYLRRARRMQEVLGWLTAELGEPAARLAARSTTEDPERVAVDARSLLKLSTEQQQQFATPAKAFDGWRAALESVGIEVFLFPLGAKSCRGFSLWHEQAPVIAVNTAWREEARIFTLLHEFGHLLTRSNSACSEWSGKATQSHDPIERWCERFAAAVLMPRDAVLHALPFHARTGTKDLRVASSLATRFRVSLRAATIRLIELKVAEWALYEEIPPIADAKPAGGGGSGRNRLEIREDEFGTRGTSLLVTAVQKDIISRSQALTYLDIPDPAFDQLSPRPGSD